MTNTNRVKGRDFEALIRRWLTDRGIPNMNPASIGRPGGDIILHNHPIMIEAKCRRETALSTWIKQAEKDAGELLLAVLVHKRRGVADPAKQWVTLDLGSFATILAACDSVKLSESVAERQKRPATPSGHAPSGTDSQT